MISLGEVAELARSLSLADRRIEEAEQALSEAKERARLLREEAIPSAMHELGLASIKLDSGQTVSIKQDVQASITEANKPAAFDWLEKNNFGGLIKTEVGVRFGKGGIDDAAKLLTELAEKGFEPTLKREVHHQTLCAFLREQLASADSQLPLDLFGARPIWTTKIKDAK